MILETINVGTMETNCYVLARGEGAQAVIIDPGAEERKIFAVLAKHRLKPGLVINTHGHYDHIGCDDKFNVPVVVHADDEIMLKDPRRNLSGMFALPYKVSSAIKTVQEKDMIELDGVHLEAWHIPGHTPGGMALLLKSPPGKVVFTGDTLFCQGIGRSDLDGGNEALLVESIRKKLLILPGDTLVYPGHGSATTISAELQTRGADPRCADPRCADPRCR
jgi:hydroxyacylglutathione hydrolase